MRYTSGEAAKKVGRSIQTLQIWEADGLIKPARDDRGWRYFTEDDIKILEKIKKEKLQVKLSGMGGEINVK
jgi:DNA-binding transcriptional MerR regulator